MRDTTIVIESADKGGSLITADLSVDYHCNCFAVPGRISDASSRGGNLLIRDNKATLIQSAEDFIEAMGWKSVGESAKPESIQRDLLSELSEEEERIVNILTRQGDLHVNSLVVEADIPVYRMTGLLFELEMKGLAKALVRGMYHLLA